VAKLPIAVAQRPAGVAPAHPTAATDGPPASGTRLDGIAVLVVDDDQDALDLSMAILTSAGAIVRTSRSAPEALEILTEWRPDVLVSDIEMPGEDGDTLIKKVRMLGPERGGHIPAIALSAYGRMQDRMLALVPATTCTSPSRSIPASSP
jgi:CheY-like chemotaxis protein